MKVCIAAGGTGGHILPGLAVAKALRARGHAAHFILKTDPAAQESLAREGFSSSAFHYAGFPRRISFDLLTFPFRSAAAYLNARRIVARERPSIMLGMGGYISVPAGLAASRAGVPLVIHEQNSVAGLANRMLARRAAAVATTFPETRGFPPGVRAELTGLPLRPEIRRRDAGESRRELGLDSGAFTYLIFGGSQGARALNRLAVAALEKISAPRDRWQVLHFAGEADAPFVESEYRRFGARAFVRKFWPDMGTAYSAADFVVGRSGAGSVMELEALGKRALLVPFPFATNDHQRANAEHLAKKGLARVVLEKDLTVDGLGSILEDAFRGGPSAPGPAVANDAAARLAALLEREAKHHDTEGR